MARVPFSGNYLTDIKNALVRAVTDGGSAWAVTGTDGAELLKRTNDTNIGNVTDHLKVVNRPGPANRLVHGHTFLLNGASSVLAVNGSVTPVVFSAGPPAGQVWWVRSLTVVLSDKGQNSVVNFGALLPLTNGVLLEWVVSAVAYQMVNITNNAGIQSVFQGAPLKGFTNGWLDTDDAYAGEASFAGAAPELRSGDLFRVTIRDDLTGLDNFKIGLNYYREI